MSDINLISAFLIGLAGGVHCVGMCGGIVAALSSACPSDKPSLPYAISYNIGRVISYTVAGALAGSIGQVSVGILPQVAFALSMASAVMLIALGLYLGNWWNGLTAIERIGSIFWRHIQPLSKQFIPFKHPLAALPYGLIWGWLPCGLVYSAVTWSLTTSNAIDGALLMLSFGLGTLPTLLLAGTGAHYIIAVFKYPLSRKIIGLSLFLYGFILIYHQIHSIN